MEWQVRREFDVIVGLRLRQLFYNVAHRSGGKKPRWMTDDVYKQVMEILEKDDKYKKRSAQNRLNRRHGSMENEVEPTHFQGSISSIQHAKKMVSIINVTRNSIW